MKYMMTTQKEVRQSFFERAKDAGLNLRKINGKYKCDTRCAFVDYVDCLQRSGAISEKLAYRVTL